MTWTATNGSDEDAEDYTEYTVTNGVVEITVENVSGSTLPETGGMGTTLFYAIGGLLVVAAAVLLITKKRMASAK